MTERTWYKHRCKACGHRTMYRESAHYYNLVIVVECPNLQCRYREAVNAKKMTCKIVNELTAAILDVRAR